MCVGRNGVNRQRVDSSSIVSIGYDPDSSILEVEFRNTRIYEYLGVPADLHHRLMAANSHGSFLNEYVKGELSLSACSLKWFFATGFASQRVDLRSVSDPSATNDAA
jgi:hypothetical protein